MHTDDERADSRNWDAFWSLVSRLDQALRMLSWRTADAFAPHDADADGCLSADELRAALQAVVSAIARAGGGGKLVLAEEEMDWLAHELAVDGDGFTDVHELQQALRSSRARAKATKVRLRGS